MRIPLLLRSIVALMAVAFLLRAEDTAQPANLQLPEGFNRVEMKVDGVERTALVYAPKPPGSDGSPLVFVFHGHGGTAAQIARRLPFNREWPEAISVYMQGLNTPGSLTDAEGKKTGWQHGRGNEDDRDLKFFDQMLAKVKQDYKVDDHRIYATGHSNGGGFTYLLWETRPDIFAAFAPAASLTKSAPTLKAKPAMHIAGLNDPLVKFEWQKMTMEAVKRNNGCNTDGKPWAQDCTIYASKSGTSLVEYIHPGGHELPPDAAPNIARFFKESPGR